MFLSVASDSADMEPSHEDIKEKEGNRFNATSLIGDVKVGEMSYIWPGSLVRGTISGVKIGDEVTILDNVIISDSHGKKTEIDEGVFISPGSVLKGCNIGKNSFIGMDSVVMKGAEIGEGAVISNGSIVPTDMKVPEGKVVAGSPAEVVGDVSERDLKRIRKIREHVNWRREEYFTMRERGERYGVDRAPSRPDEIRALLLDDEENGGAAEI